MKHKNVLSTSIDAQFYISRIHHYTMGTFLLPFSIR